jgi:hypothetical protein
MSTSLNRRAILAGAAVLPAIAIPAAAQCVLQIDPIYPAIEAHRVATDEAVQTGRLRRHLEQTLPKEATSWQGQIDSGLDLPNDKGVTERYYLENQFQIDDYVYFLMGLTEKPEMAGRLDGKGPITATEGKAMRERLMDQLAASKQEAEQRRIASGFEAAVDASQAALDEHDNATKALCATVPTTRAGVLALVKYCAENEAAALCDDVRWPITIDTQHTAALLGSLAKALGSTV